MKLSFGLILGAAVLAIAQDESSESSAITASASASASATADTTAAPSSTSASSTSDGPMTHTVGVAKGGHTFEPDITQARSGDFIKFEFYPTNHSVIRAEYGFPCIPYEYTGIDKVGFYSGFKPVDVILDDPPSYLLKLNDTDPIFFYCGAPGSCIDWQMVGVINPNATTSLQNHKQLAKDSSFMLTPGQAWPDESEDPFTTASPTDTSSSTSTSVAGAGSTAGSSATSSSDRSSLSVGAIAGIAIGATAVAVAAAAFLYICGRQSRRHSHAPLVEERPGTGHAAMQPMAYNPHGHPQSPYMDHTKHMSMHSSMMPNSPPLPGYVPPYDPAMSPALHHTYPMSDSFGLKPGSDVSTLHSTSPNPMYAVPAYPNQVPQNMSPYGFMPPPPPPPPQAPIHEMAGSDALPGQSQGHPSTGHTRQSSISKLSSV